MKIPKTDSIRELADFWDTHDLTDFEDEAEEVRGRVFERPSADAVTVPLSSDERRAIKEMAEARGIGEGALIRQWVKEKLQHP